MLEKGRGRLSDVHNELTRKWFGVFVLIITLELASPGMNEVVHTYERANDSELTSEFPIFVNALCMWDF